MTKRKFLSLCALLLLAGCSGAKEKLGLVKEAPDEFAVVKRAPLEMPPDFALRPPAPGMARPQEQSIDSQARAAVFGMEEQAPAQAAAPASAEAYLLQQTGGDRADPSIRRTVDVETAKIAPVEQPVAKRLIGIGRTTAPEAVVVDPVGETNRLQQNAAAGKPVTAGETPSKKE